MTTVIESIMPHTPFGKKPSCTQRLEKFSGNASGREKTRYSPRTIIETMAATLTMASQNSISP